MKTEHIPPEILKRILDGSLKNGDRIPSGEQLTYSAFAVMYHPTSLETLMWGFDAFGSTVQKVKFPGGKSQRSEFILETLAFEIHEETSFDTEHLLEYIQQGKDGQMKVRGIWFPSNHGKDGDIHAMLFFLIRAPREWCTMQPKTIGREKKQGLTAQWVDVLKHGEQLAIKHSHAIGMMLYIDGIRTYITSKEGEFAPPVLERINALGRHFKLVEEGYFIDANRGTSD